MSKHLRVAAVLAALALAIAACGDGTSTSTSTSTSEAEDVAAESVPATTTTAMADMDTMADADHDHDTEGSEHSHAGSVEAAAPMSVELEVVQDPKAGYNLFFATTGFTWAPEHASTENIDGEGHAHLYVDGEKIGRIYGEAFYVGALAEGPHEITIELNTNTHAPYPGAGRPVAATAMVESPAPAEMSHMHPDPVEAAAPMTVELEVAEDPVAGYNLFFPTTGFTWAPEHASTEHIDGEGHAHLYVDGVKVGRIYTEAYHLGRLEPGSHEITIELNTNTHAPYAVNGEPVAQTATVVVAGEVEAVAPDHVFEVTIASDGSVEGPDRPEVMLGDVVQLLVSGPVSDEVHVHGYDIYDALEPGQMVEITFTADVPGIFEVELEGAGALLLELKVS
jgi:hypothetical protein